MPAPTGSKTKRCAMQRAIFHRDPEAGKRWVEEYGDQCKGVKMKTTRKIAKDGRNRLASHGVPK